jgi:hypothetical protein
MDIKILILRVYCKYHYLEGHEFLTPEEELRHFLKRLEDPDWKWMEQYEAGDIQDPLECMYYITKALL